MALRFVATRPDPDLLTLPWNLPLEDWGSDRLVALPQGISRHVVRLVRLGPDVYAVKETRPRMAFREYRMLRDLRRLGLPAVEPVGVVEGRATDAGEEIEPALVTRHLRFSLPYRSVFAHGLRAESVPRVIDALAVLLVRLHLAGFFWGDVSLSNVLFRRSAGEFAAYLVDAETGELHPQLSSGQREQDLEVAETNLYGELLDLQAGRLLDEGVDPLDTVARARRRYDTLWQQLTGSEEFSTDQMWRIEQRIERLNDLGFDVDELDIVSDLQGATVRLQPKVVEAGHHSRELQSLTGLDVEENQARRLLNDLASFATSRGIDAEDKAVVAHRWLTEVYEPVTELIPRQLRGRREPAEVFHEILEHRWFLSERAGHEVDIFEATEAYVDEVLAQHPEEAIAATGSTGSTDWSGHKDVQPSPNSGL